MRKKIRFFRQHTMETCGASCILMLLDYYRKLQYPTKKMELMRYKEYRSYAFRGMPASSVAACLSWNGLQVELLHSEDTMLVNRDGYFEEELFDAIFREYRMWAQSWSHRVDVRTGQALDCDRLKKELAAGKQVMVQCIVPGNADGIHTEVLHWVLVYGWTEEGFRLCDPNFGKTVIPEADMARYMDTPIGHIFVTVRGE